MDTPPRGDAHRIRRNAMRLSLAIAFLMLAGKVSAYAITGSAAILSDALESIIHVAAIAFASFSLWLSAKPPGEQTPYGYERITFFSAGFEGGMIIAAGFAIIASAAQKWRAGLEFEQLGLGTALIMAASLVNLWLGWHLIQTGRRTGSLILVADGKHVLTDSWTSFGVVAGLLLVLATGWKPFDPLVAIAVAVNILWSGYGLVRQAVRGLLDIPDPAQAQTVREAVERVCAEAAVAHHGLRFRDTGQRLIVFLHLLFPDAMPIGKAHRLATRVERRLAEELATPVEVVTHLESLEDHRAVHGEGV